VAALLQAMPQEHERGLGNWQAELAEWTGLLLSVHGSLKALADAAAGLRVDTARMRHNLRLLGDALPPDADFDVAAGSARQRAEELLQRLRPQAAALAARRPWQPWLP
jgi:3-carboxy-cis,cis-muconate cycloisomerase